ncbi:TonB-dependent receptor [Ferruginibacter lapsinanis]|uniref:TonB-dependent receptor n=1 Tax=Ferruginibacter lapsinanis TaxID=563172 RepID=UPI00293EA8BB|nr:TonB-dependent receptor [Ferruginibacter lapsinanis]
MRLSFTLTGMLTLVNMLLMAQTGTISGRVKAANEVVQFASVVMIGVNDGVLTDSLGNYSFKNLKAGIYKLRSSAQGYLSSVKTITVTEGENVVTDLVLTKHQHQLDEVVITGTLKEVKRIESPVPVEVYSPAFFKKNPTPSIFDALQNVNGVRPQLNCNVCNTGDIHINGLEGPYTMVLIDGMPIVSSLATVYGLSGIPNCIVERIEIVKGPASSLYGSEAVGGLINIITKSPTTAPIVSADVMATSWKEFNADLGFKFNAGKNASVLTGANYFKYDNIVDINNDNFTDVTLQDRFSLFQKWNFQRKEGRALNLAARYFGEDRWGGDVRWTKAFRGGDSIYGESIYTKRWELLGNYQLPTKEKLMLSLSYNDHDQDSRYGKIIYDAAQRIAFTQLTWDKTIKRHDLLAGAALRYTFYDDNTAATAINSINKPDKIWLPGIFLQDEITLSHDHKFLAGFRYDHNSRHGNIFTPRIAYKWSINSTNIVRLNAGTGFRVVNLFTEDHAALTGARFVEVKNELKPEKSYNANINYIKKIYGRNGMFIGIELTGWYTYFNNRIIADYDTDPNKIIYDNINGFAESKGMSANLDISWRNGLKILAGATYMHVTTTENGVKEQQILTEKFTGTWAVSYKIKKIDLAFDYTGNIYGPMRLPLLGKLDPRLANSPVWSIQNIQLLYSGFKKCEIYGGVKNLLNFTPAKNNPFIIARTDDPFDKHVQYDSNGQVMATPSNPYALTFDPTYMFAPNQGIRGFMGVRYTLK